MGFIKRVLCQITTRNRFIPPLIKKQLVMTLTITNLRVDYRESEGYFIDGKPCPYLILNVVFHVERDEDTFLWERAKGMAEEYQKVLTIDDPECYEAFIMDWDLNCRTTYPGYSRSWTHQDPPWRYLPKFDSFHFREWIADCTVTRAIIAELQYFKEHGKLPSVYRSVEGGIILTHMEVLQRYWD
jgi:hypothetical protein